ncbi:MAG TPA: hypothetical protein PLS82_14945 [Phycisphaerae bacterium]|jgi:hypothetical protein|nr:hypothetical protein [Phycisphaerae bacterium]
MRVRRHLPVIVVALTLPFLMGQACPFLQPPPPSQTELTPEEQTAIEAALQATAALSQAAGITQLPVNPNIDPEEEPPVTTEGTCPVITTEASAAAEGRSRNVTINFGAAACPAAPFPGLSCSGSATGTLNRFAATLSLTFNNLSCASQTLNGQVQAAYEFAPAGANLNGTFNLTWTSDGQDIAITGQGGLLGFDRATNATTLGVFNASVSASDAAYTVGFTNVVLAYQNNPDLLPSSGVITITGPTIRQLTIRFNENSPTTGEAEVRIAGGPFFTVNLLAL